MLIFGVYFSISHLKWDAGKGMCLSLLERGEKWREENLTKQESCQIWNWLKEFCVTKHFSKTYQSATLFINQPVMTGVSTHFLHTQLLLHLAVPADWFLLLRKQKAQQTGVQDVQPEEYGIPNCKETDAITNPHLIPHSSPQNHWFSKIQSPASTINIIWEHVRPHLRLTKSKTLGRRPSNLCFNKLWRLS